MKKSGRIYNLTASLILSCFLLESIFPFPNYAQTLPAPTQFISLTPKFTPPSVRGLRFYPDNPLRFDFIIDEGERKLDSSELKEQSSRFIRHFLASLTIPEEDLWVNLSPQEPDRIIPSELGITQMGIELLGQDYVLKQLIGSLTYPESAQGKNFWQKVYQKATELFGTSKIPISTYNKIWIVPYRAEVFEDKDRAILGNTRLKVMLEEDYLLLKDNLSNPDARKYKLKEDDVKEINNFSSKLMKETVLPEIEKEVNEGKNFQELRQIYNCLILAIWFKQRLKESILNQVYINQKKTKGIDTNDPKSKENIYNLYLQAYKEGLYNYIRSDTDPATGKAVRRRYYSGGFDGTGLPGIVVRSSSPLSNIPEGRLDEIVDPTPEKTPLQNLSFEVLDEGLKPAGQEGKHPAPKAQDPDDGGESFLSGEYDSDLSPFIPVGKISVELDQPVIQLTRSSGAPIRTRGAAVVPQKGGGTLTVVIDGKAYSQKVRDIRGNDFPYTLELEFTHSVNKAFVRLTTEQKDKFLEAVAKLAEDGGIPRGHEGKNPNYAMDRKLTGLMHIRFEGKDNRIFAKVFMGEKKVVIVGFLSGTKAHEMYDKIKDGNDLRYIAYAEARTYAELKSIERNFYAVRASSPLTDNERYNSIKEYLGILRNWINLRSEYNPEKKVQLFEVIDDYLFQKGIGIDPEDFRRLEESRKRFNSFSRHVDAPLSIMLKEVDLALGIVNRILGEVKSMPVIKQQLPSKINGLIELLEAKKSMDSAVTSLPDFEKRSSAIDKMNNMMISQWASGSEISSEDSQKISELPKADLILPGLLIVLRVLKGRIEEVFNRGEEANLRELFAILNRDDSLEYSSHASILKPALTLLRQSGIIKDSERLRWLYRLIMFNTYFFPFSLSILDVENEVFEEAKMEALEVLYFGLGDILKDEQTANRFTGWISQRDENYRLALGGGLDSVIELVEQMAEAPDAMKRLFSLTTMELLLNTSLDDLEPIVRVIRDYSGVDSKIADLDDLQVYRMDRIDRLTRRTKERLNLLLDALDDKDVKAILEGIEEGEQLDDDLFGTKQIHGLVNMFRSAEAHIKERSQNETFPEAAILEFARKLSVDQILDDVKTLVSSLKQKGFPKTAGQLEKFLEEIEGKMGPGASPSAASPIENKAGATEKPEARASSPVSNNAEYLSIAADIDKLNVFIDSIVVAARDKNVTTDRIQALLKEARSRAQEIKPRAKGIDTLARRYGEVNERMKNLLKGIYSNEGRGIIADVRKRSKNEELTELYGLSDKEIGGLRRLSVEHYIEYLPGGERKGRLELRMPLDALAEAYNTVGGLDELEIIQDMVIEALPQIFRGKEYPVAIMGAATNLLKLAAERFKGSGYALEAVRDMLDNEAKDSERDAAYFGYYHDRRQAATPMSEARASSPVSNTLTNEQDEHVGGIDLNPAGISLEVKKKDGITATGHIPSASLIPFDLQNFQGFTFRIIKIEPVSNLVSLIRG